MTPRTAQSTVPAGDLTGGHQVTLSAGLMAALAVTQTIGYGTLYYAFAVLMAPLATALHTNTTTITGAYAASVLTGAALAVPVGRYLDRHGGRLLMTAGSVAGVLLLLAWSQVTTVWQLYVVQIGIGAASAASLYEAAFAVVIAISTTQQRPNALLALTVVAGFSSTIFLPLTGWLVAANGWRTALLVLAAIQAVTIGLHVLAVRGPGHQTPDRSPHRVVAPGAVRSALADRGFWLLALGFTAHTAAITALTVHLVAALISWDTRPPSPPPSPGCSECCLSPGDCSRPACNAATAPPRSPPACSPSKPAPPCCSRSSAPALQAQSAQSSASGSASA